MIYNSILHGGSQSMPIISHCESHVDEAWLSSVLEKANVALYYDIKGDIQGAIDTYEETIHLLQRVLARGEDKSPLREFHDLYARRVQVLSDQLLLTGASNANDMLHSIAEELRLPNDRPLSLTNESKTSHDSSGPTTPVSSWITPDDHSPPPVPDKCLPPPPPPPASSIFAAMFAKRAHKPSPSDHGFIPPPKPSQSTPTISINRPSLWTQNMIRKNRHSSDFTPPRIRPAEVPLPSLPLPVLSSPDDDYFGFGASGANGLLFEASEPTLDSRLLAHPKPTAQRRGSLDPQFKALPNHTMFSVTGASERDHDLHIPDKRASAIENLHKVLAETDDPGAANGIVDSECRHDVLATTADKTQEVVPPPRTHSITLDRIGLSKIGLATRHKQQQPQPQQVEEVRPLRNQSSSISLSGFWKQHKNQPALQISTSSLRMRGHSFSGGRSPQSPPIHPGRQGSATSSELSFRRGSLFSVSSASAIHGASPLKEKVQPDVVFASAPACTDTPQEHTLLKRIQKSMVDGGFITERLYAPRQLWCQPGVRLPSLDTKLAVCRLLMDDLTPMQGRDHFEDVRSARHELAALEHTLDRIKMTFSRKLGMGHDREEVESNSGVSKEVHAPVSSKTSMTIAAWGSKLSKSMERMKLDTLRSSDEQFNLYFLALQRLFTLSLALDMWQEHYDDMARQTMDTEKIKAEDYRQLAQKTRVVSDTFHKLVCGFVMRDFARLLSKWMKRSREWTDE